MPLDSRDATRAESLGGRRESEGDAVVDGKTAEATTGEVATTEEVKSAGPASGDTDQAGAESPCAENPLGENAFAEEASLGGAAAAGNANGHLVLAERVRMANLLLEKLDAHTEGKLETHRAVNLPGSPGSPTLVRESDVERTLRKKKLAAVKSQRAAARAGSPGKLW